MKGRTMWTLMLVGMAFLPATAIHAGRDRDTGEERLTILVEEPDDTTRIQIPLSWLEVGMDIIKVLEKKSADTSGVRINWDSLKVALRNFRGGILRVEEDSERVFMFIGTPKMRCPCLEMEGKGSSEQTRVLVNLDVARNVLRHGKIEGISPDERDRLLKFLEDPRLGEALEIASSSGDTLRIRIVGNPQAPR